MIYGIWYPSGGFGHFINAVISLSGKQFCRPNDVFKLGDNGNCHATSLVLPKYRASSKSSWYLPSTDPNLHYTVLIDNGINNENKEFFPPIPTLKIIKICYDDRSWPVVAKTCIIKAMCSSLAKEVAIDDNKWPSNSDWAQREKFFLFLRDHEFRHQWRPDSEFDSIPIQSLFTYENMRKVLEELGIETEDFAEIWQQWFDHNRYYLSPVIIANRVMQSIRLNQDQDLSFIDDVWDQAVIYYFIWLEFAKEVPHNDFQNFFKNTQQIVEWLQT